MDCALILTVYTKWDTSRVHEKFFQVFSQPNWARVLKFPVWVYTTVLYMAFSNFWNRATRPTLEGLKPPQKTPFKYFLIELECWNIRCGLRRPFCMRLFWIFEIGSLCSPREGFLNLTFGRAPKSQILNLLCDFDEIWNATFSYVYQ